MTERSGEVPELDVVGLFREEIRPEVLEALVEAIRDQSRAAAQLAAGLFAKDQAKEAAPHLRRAGLGSALLKFEEKFPEVTVHSIRCSGSSYYVQVDIGRITILCARARNPKMMLPEAAYRTRIATSSLQHWLFGDEAPPPDARVYCVVLYGGPGTQVDPQFVVARFPIREHREYLDEMVNLKYEFQHLFRQSSDESLPLQPEGMFEAAVEQIEDQTRSSISIRRKPTTGSSEDA